MAKIKVAVTKESGFTKRVLAHDGVAGLLIVDKEGVQEVTDHPRVHQLISEGVIEKKSGRAAASTDQEQPDTKDESKDKAEAEAKDKK